LRNGLTVIRILNFLACDRSNGTEMRRLRLSLAVLIVLALNAASSADAASSDTSDANTSGDINSSGVATVLVDPSLKGSIYFPPGVATAGVAAVSATPENLQPAKTPNCSSTNPCAIPPPAADRVVIDSGSPKSSQAKAVNRSRRVRSATGA
jgi:hypothetical protein